MSSSDLDFLNSLMASSNGVNSSTNQQASSINNSTSTVADSVPLPISASQDQLSDILRAIAISSGEENVSEYDDKTVAELLERLEQADGVTDGLEERLDGLLSQLDGMLEQLEPIQDGQSEKQDDSGKTAEHNQSKAGTARKEADGAKESKEK